MRSFVYVSISKEIQVGWNALVVGGSGMAQPGHPVKIIIDRNGSMNVVIRKPENGEKKTYSLLIQPDLLKSIKELVALDNEISTQLKRFAHQRATNLKRFIVSVYPIADRLRRAVAFREHAEREKLVKRLDEMYKSKVSAIVEP